MKYIIFLNGEPVIFPDTLSHNEVAGNKPVISAGFCSIETYRNQWDDIRAKVQVWGESYTLKIKSSPDDVEILGKIWRA